MTLIQRSNDYIMSGYINKAQYTALLLMVAGHLRYKVGKFVHFVQNLHVYDRHFNAVDEILTRPIKHIQPKIELKEQRNFYDYTVDDFIIIDNIGQKLESKLELAI